ncbi:hypothetical protein [Subtercola sp. RTI3]|uniref:hypothetical protein n=1 Tax=Subtercola sp. RTI3 TaxID=3048639 RepID=UPI002B23C6B6|nr:hypothetical protein [Subtercola sp. RTI3]MEA9986841.1 hypothetical protein [Subtercola sp. RTI3]
MRVGTESMPAGVARRRRRLTVVVGILLTITASTLTACTSGSVTTPPISTASPSVSGTATPVSTAGPIASGSPSGVGGVTEVVLNADALELRAASGTVIWSFSYAHDAAGALTALTGLLGSASSKSIPADKCSFESTISTWPDLVMTVFGPSAPAPGTFSVVSDTTAPTIDITTPNGARVGGSLAAYRPAVAGHESISAPFNDTFRVVDTATADAAAPYAAKLGSVVFTEFGTITLLTAPAYVDFDC